MRTHHGQPPSEYHEVVLLTASLHPWSWAAWEYPLRVDGTLRMSEPMGKSNPCSRANPWFINPGLVWTGMLLPVLGWHASNTQ